MRWDNYGLIQMEQNPEGDPGNLGDSFAETFRVLTLEYFTGQRNPYDAVQKYQAVRTPKGFVRHPDSPWREDDFSGDQFTPGYIALDIYGQTACRADMEAVVFLNSWRTGNNDLMPANFWAAKSRADGKPSWFKDLSILAQAYGMRYLPYRWNDEKRWFESTKNSSADYLNWIMLLVHAHVKGHTWATRRALRVFTRNELYGKVLDYYAPEPNAGWVLSLYFHAILEVFK